ncbi:hypothetical protein [Streptomyces sp. NPDC060002]|uniref:hypothetical protein n=1 Tax=Streptomyces sp. NPDC060002 TaxID=3347033 RepID=UPI00367ECCB7
MSSLFAVAYDDLATADQVRAKLFELPKEHWSSWRTRWSSSGAATAGSSCTRR